MSNETQHHPEYEMFRDPFRMLVQLAVLVAEEQGVELDYNRVPAYENDTFLLRPDSEEGIPNFIYKKDGTEISWYQSLGRDILCSKDLSRQEYNKMFVDCMASIYHFA